MRAVAPDRARRATTYAGALAVGAVFFALVGTFDFVCDDEYIAFRYAANWADSGRLEFNPGEHVEGFSSPAFVALLAAARRFGLPVEASAEWASLVSSVVLIAALHRTVCAFESRVPALAFCSMLVTALSAPLLVYARAGLETATFSVFAFASIDSCIRTRNRTDIPLHAGLGILVASTVALRPEGFLAAAIAAAIVVATGRKRGARAVSAFAAVLGGVVVALAAARFAYFGSFVANTWIAKAPDSTFQLAHRGLDYLKGFLGGAAWPVLGCAASVGLACVVPRRASTESISSERWWIFAGTTYVLVSIASIVIVGGDFMEGGRFFHPLVAPFVVAVAASVAVLDARMVSNHANARIGEGIALGAIVTLASYSEVSRFIEIREGNTDRVGTMSARALREQVTLERALAAYLAPHLHDDDWIATRAAGVVPFETRALTVDALGLCDAYIARSGMHVDGPVGHRRLAPLEYLLRRRPVVLLLDGAAPSRTRYALPEDPTWRASGYEWVTTTLQARAPNRTTEWFLPILVRVDRAEEFGSSRAADRD